MNLAGAFPTGEPVGYGSYAGFADGTSSAGDSRFRISLKSCSAEIICPRSHCAIDSRRIAFSFGLTQTRLLARSCPRRKFYAPRNDNGPPVVLLERRHPERFHMNASRYIFIPLLLVAVSLPLAAQSNDTYVIPGAANASGNFGTRSLTQFSVFNPQLDYPLRV